MMKKSDLQLKQDIEDELRWDPKVNAAQIGVGVEKGSVSLLGSVDTFAEKWEAEAAAKRVAGVRVLAQDLKVKILKDHERSDSEVAAAVESGLTWDVYVPKTVTARVENGAVTLAGQATWNFQRDAAVRAVRHLKGVTCVFNTITLEPRTLCAQVKEEIGSALKRQATADTHSIHIHTSDGKVTLTGTASSWKSIEDAENAAWAAPGVTNVIDKVKVSMST